jgi:hypothetical protein
MMFYFGPLGLFLLLFLFRPLRRFAAFVFMIVLILAIGTFGHVALINKYPIIAVLIAAWVWWPTKRGRYR